MQQIRTFLDRQPKIEALLTAGDASGFPALYDMDLTPPPELCAAAHQFLQQRIPGFKPAAATAQYADIRDTVESYENTLRWLTKNHCDLRSDLDALQAVLMTYPDHDSAILFFTALDDMRRDLGQ